MKPGLGAGVVAGAVGALVIEGVSWLDILVRGRPPSELPDQAARNLAGRLGVDLDPDTEAGRNRTGALAALLGYGAGVAIGAAYGVVARDRRGGPLAGLALAAGAMVPGNLPLVAMGLTDPRTWGVAGWLSDIVPHLAYGLATAATYRAITGTEEG